MQRIKKYIYYLVIYFIIIFYVNNSFTQNIFSLDGYWKGILTSFGQELRIVFKVIKDDSQKYFASLDSPDQNVFNIPVTSVIFDDRIVIFKIKSVGIYKGFMQDDNKTIVGKWLQNGRSFICNLSKIDTISILSRTQEPERPFPYVEKHLDIENYKAKIKLAGTLTLPNLNGNHPLVILISGSGAQDRDETIFNHRPFLILADYLTRKGFAVFRYDDRGVGGSTGSYSNSTFTDLSEDVNAIYNYFIKHNDINCFKIGLIGHSEGGLVASISASNLSGISFVVLMASPGIVGSELICDQVANLGRASGLKADVIASNVDLERQILEIVKNYDNNKIALEKLIEIVPNNRRSQINILLSPRYRFMLSFDPKNIYTKLKCPVLAINGEKDIQVSSLKNLYAISNTLHEGGNTNFTVLEIPNVNHLFQTAKTGYISEYGKIEESFSTEVLKIISKWIQEVLQ
jgi:pimeloyl-ACP methyl ester carboxylesterase